MKKLLFAFAFAAVVLVSCEKTPQPAPSKLAPAKYQGYHASLVLDDAVFTTPLKKGDIPKTIDITSGGKFLLGFYDTDAAEPEKAPLKYKSGKYQLIEAKAPSAGMQFIFEMYGSLTIKEESGNTMTVEYINPKGNAYTGPAILRGDSVSGALADNLCRSWKPEEIIVSASGGDLTSSILGKKFPADINAIVSYLKEKGVKVVGDYSKYTLESIDYTEGGMMLINFKDFAIAPFVGNFSLKESQDENIAYNFDLSWEDNPVIPVSGAGTVSLSGEKLSLYTESDVVIQGKSYHISITIVSSEIK